MPNPSRLETLLSQDPRLNGKPLQPVNDRYSFALGEPSMLTRLQQGRDPAAERNSPERDASLRGLSALDEMRLEPEQTHQLGQVQMMHPEQRLEPEPTHQMGQVQMGPTHQLGQVRMSPEPTHQLGQVRMSEPKAPQMTTKELQRRERVWQSLQAKAMRGSGQPGEGSIPLSAIPAQARAMVKADERGAPVAWRPSQLTPEERLLLGQLQVMESRNAKKVHDEAMKELGGVRP